MDRMGIFEKYDVKVLGTSIKTLETSEDRDLLYVESTLIQSHKGRRGNIAEAITKRDTTVRKL